MCSPQCQKELFMCSSLNPPGEGSAVLKVMKMCSYNTTPPGEGSADLRIMFMSPFTPPIMPLAASCDEGSPGRPRPQRTPDQAAW